MLNLVTLRTSIRTFLRVGLVLTCCFCLFAAAPNASADRIFTLPNIVVNADGLVATPGQILATLEITGVDIGADLIRGYNIDFLVPAGVNLTGAPDMSTDAPGIYSFGNYTDFPSSPVKASDDTNAAGAVLAATGGLSLVDFEIPAGVTNGVFPLTWGSFNFLNDAQNVELDIITRDGSITVIPEPSSMALGLLASSLLLCLRRRR